jgi:hypothetical protein
MSIIENNITLSKHRTRTKIPGTFSQVEVTADGRCFFGSVWLGSLVDNVGQIAALEPRIDKFNIKKQDNELNTWMQKNVINRLDSVQQTCRFLVYIRLYQHQVKLNVYDSTLEDIIPHNFVGMCLKHPNSDYIKERLPKMIKNTSKSYLKFKNEFITYYKSLNVLKYSTYPYAEPNVGLAQELANSLGQNITIVNPDGVINEDAIYWVNMQENDKKMIYVCKLDAEHYRALIPEIPGKLPAFLSSPSSAAKMSKKEAAELAASLEEEARAKKRKEEGDKATALTASRKEAAAIKKKEEEDFAAAMEASLKEEAIKKKEEEDFAATIEASLKEAAKKKKEDAKLVTPAKPQVIPAKTTTIPPVIPTKPTTVPPVVVSPTTPMVPTKPTTVPPVVPTTSSTSTSTPVKCPVSKTQIPIYYVVFTSPNQVGDYSYMIKQPEYKNTLFIFNDNQKDYYTLNMGSGNAIIRPYNYYGWKRKGLTKPLSAGIPTGNDKGYTQLDMDTLFQINRAIDDIGTILEKFKSYDQIIYSGTNNQNPRFKDDPEDLIGIGKYEVSKKVREYITQQIKCLGDFKGKLKQTTPLKDIQNAAIMLFVNNSAKVVFVHDPKNNKWMLPGGRIDNKETPWAAAAREYEEEVGYKLPSNLQEKDFDYFDYRHTKGEYTRIFIGKTDVKSPPYDVTKVKNKETDKLECRLLSDVLLNQQNYSPVILKSTEAIYNKINKEGEYLEYAKPETAPQSTTAASQSTTTASQSTTTAPQSTTTRTAPVSKKNVTFSQIPESLSKSTTTPSKDNLKYVKESFPKKLTNNNNSNKNNITERNNQYLSTRNKIQNGYVMAANSIKKYNNAPFTSNPKQHIAMGTGAGLAVLAGLTFVGGKKNLSRKKRTGTRKRSHKTQKSSCFSRNKRRKGKKCYKTHKKRR